tara:strand:- start:714 stop:917 length:204 start_codon:yes stop_codon:yes gene_type:complete
MIQTATKMAKFMKMDTVFSMPVGWVSKVAEAWSDEEVESGGDTRSHVEAQMRKLNHGSRQTRSRDLG